MKKFLFFAAITMFTKVGFTQTQSIVIQKNALPVTATPFAFTASGPLGTTVSAAFNLIDNGDGKQPNDIGASSSGAGYLGVTEKSTNNVYLYTSGDANWTQPAGNSAVRMDIETNGTNWQINSSNNIYRGGVAEGTATDVGVGPDNSVYIIGTDTKIYKWNGIGTTTYTILSGSPTGIRVDGGPSGTAWYVGSNGHAYYYNGTTSIDNGLAPGSLAFVDIAVGADGKAWAIATNPTGTSVDHRTIYYWDGTSWILDALAPTGTTMYNVTVGADNEPLLSLNFNGGRNYLLKRLSDGRWVVINALTANNNNLIFYNQPIGSYTFTESVTAGYYLQDIIIFGSTGDSYSTATGITNLSLGTNEHAYIQYTNVTGTMPAATSIGTTCGSTFVETFGTITSNTTGSLPVGQTTYTYNTNPMGHYQGNGTNDGQYDVVSSVFDATGYYYQWISGPGVNGAACSYNCDIHGGGAKDASDHDHTGNANGGMLLVNADFSAGVFYEKQYTGLVPGNSYQFSAWLANILLNVATYSTNPNAILRVVDPNTGAILLDLPTGDIPKSATNTLDWKQYAGSFIASGSTVTVYLINNKPGGDGNDLVMDDIAFTATCQTVSGTIFNDGNGMSDGLVNGIGTNTVSPLYAVLTDASNNIVSSALIPGNGTYSFSNIFSGNYSVKITTTVPGAIGTPAPNASLTGGWVNTGDSLGSNNGNGTGFKTTGNLDSMRIQVGTSFVTGVNFGIELPPSANNVTSPTLLNPGLTNTVTVPTLTGNDPEQGSFPGTGNADTLVISTIPNNAVLYYNNVPVAAGDTIKNYNPALLTIDPNDGTITLTFTYKEIDAALVGSTPATVTIPLNAMTISGKIFNDANGMSDGLVNGTGSNAGNSLYVVLTDANSNIIASTLLAADGSYNFSNINSNTNYRVQITFQLPGGIGTQVATPILTTGWANTGDSLGTYNIYGGGFLTQGNLNVLFVNVGVNSVSGVDFGIEQSPTANNVMATIQNNPGGTNTLVVPTLNGSDPEQGNFPGTGNADTVVIKTLPTNATLYYDFGAGPVVLNNNDTIKNYNPALLTVDPNDGITSIVFKYVEIDAALISSNVATLTIPLNNFTISGNVFDDRNGYTDQLVNGIPVNGLDIDAAESGNQALYAQLIVAGGGIIATAPVQNDGTYSFSGVGAGTYTVTINQTSDGTSAGPLLPDNWIFTGDHQGLPTTVGSDENPDGSLSGIVVSNADITDIDFGIDHLPVADPKTAAIQLNPGGTVRVAVPTLTGTDLEDGIYPGTGNKDTIIIQTLPTNGTLYYDYEDGNGPVPIVQNIGGTVIPDYNPALLTLDPDDGTTLTVTFTYSEVDAANKQSVAALVTIPFGIVMPVTITTFTAKEDNAKVNLSWNTALEINTKYFTIERSIDNKNFGSIGNIQAIGTAGNYQYVDVTPATGYNFYRLKMIDKDGSITYGKVVTINVEGGNIGISSVSPNPFVSRLTVHLNLQQPGAVKISLIDAEGQIVYRTVLNAAKGINLLNIDGLDKLARGMYIINIDAENNNTQQKIIKL